MQKDRLPTVEIEPSIPAKASIIWLHGLGANGHDFVEVVSELHLPKELGVRFIFPHAPARPVTVNQGMVMPAWYDINHDLIKEDEPGIRAAEEQVRDLIVHEQQRGIPANKIVLAGFSQGGAVALQCGLRFPDRLAGIMALSTYLPLAKTVEKEASPKNKDVPILMLHGIMDPVIYLQWAEFSSSLLKGLGYHVTWRSYPMAHSVCPEEISDISKWLQKVLA